MNTEISKLRIVIIDNGGCNPIFRMLPAQGWEPIVDAVVSPERTVLVQTLYQEKIWLTQLRIA